jgi:hypothetical protein
MLVLVQVSVLGKRYVQIVWWVLVLMCLQSSTPVQVAFLICNANASDSDSADAGANAGANASAGAGADAGAGAGARCQSPYKRM